MRLLAFRDDANDPLAKLRLRPLADHLVHLFQGFDLTSVSSRSAVKAFLRRLLSRLSS
jgi:hypothetical protein